jgi:hypothetical protein
MPEPRESLTTRILYMLLSHAILMPTWTGSHSMSVRGRWAVA